MVLGESRRLEIATKFALFVIQVEQFDWNYYTDWHSYS